MGALAQSTFVDEDDSAPFAAGFFLSAGQRDCCQCRIAASSRSSAFAGRSLAGPIELAQDAPDVVLVVTHPGPILDELTHPVRGPQPGGKAESFRAAFERALDLVQLRRAKLGWSSNALGLAQSSHTRLCQRPGPAADRLPMRAHRAGDLGLAQAFAQQSCRLHASLLQGP